MKLIPRFLALATLLPAGGVFAQCADISLAPTTLPNATQGTPYSATFKPGGRLARHLVRGGLAAGPGPEQRRFVQAVRASATCC